MTTTLTPKKEQTLRPFFGEFFANDPFATLTSVRRTMNSLFDTALRPGVFQEYVPAMDLYNHDGVYVIEVALPGLEKKDVDIEVDGNRLTIFGKYAIDTAETEKVRRYHYRELRRGNFYRSVAFPEEIDPANVVATFDHGILKIEVPSMRPLQPKKVAIK